MKNLRKFCKKLPLVRSIVEDMSFEQRAVRACMSSMLAGVVSERQIRDVLACKDVDVSCFEQFLANDDCAIRRATVRMIGEKGNAELLLDAALKETNSPVLFEMLEYMGKRKCAIQPLKEMVESKDTMVREAAISMFRRAGHLDDLFPLLFSEDDALVKRIARYLEHDDQQSETAN
jgi:HEAT repeat protein